MLIDKEFLKILKYEDVKKLTWGENLSILETVVNEYNKKTSLSLVVDDILDKNYIIWILYVLNVQWELNNVTGKYFCSKLNDEYSLPFYLYSHILENYSEYYKLISGDILGVYMVYPDDIHFMPYTLRKILKDKNIIFSDEDEDENIASIAADGVNIPKVEDNCNNIDTTNNNVENNYSDRDTSIENNNNYTNINKENDSKIKNENNINPINILWISRHPIFESQITDLKNIYNNINLYQTRERIHNINEIIKTVNEYKISVVVAVLPDSIIVELHGRLPNGVSLLKSSYAQSSIPIKCVDDGDKNAQLCVFSGFERVCGYRLITESI